MDHNYLTLMTSLGICIPTYKRPDFLRRCVLSALKAAGDRPIRIFISDDSTDDTNAALYEELRAYSSAIVTIRNRLNLGIDDNIQRCVALCDCDYAWIIGEDDYFLPGSVSRIHDLLQERDNPFVFANYNFVNDAHNQIIRTALRAPDGEITSAEFVRKHLWAAGFIGGCIVNRNCWNNTSAAPYIGTYYTHVGRICEMLAQPNSRVYIVATPCVANRAEGADTFTWKHDSYGVLVGFRNMCEAVAKQFPSIKSEVLEAGRMATQGFLRLSLAMRLRSELGYDQTQYRRYLKPYLTSPIKRLAFYLISVMPPSIFGPPVIAYRLLRRLQTTLGQRQ